MYTLQLRKKIGDIPVRTNQIATSSPVSDATQLLVGHYSIKKCTHENSMPTKKKSYRV